MNSIKGGICSTSCRFLRSGLRYSPSRLQMYVNSTVPHDYQHGKYSRTGQGRLDLCLCRFSTPVNWDIVSATQPEHGQYSSTFPHHLSSGHQGLSTKCWKRNLFQSLVMVFRNSSTRSEGDAQGHGDLERISHVWKSWKQKGGSLDIRNNSFVSARWEIGTAV